MLTHGDATIVRLVLSLFLVPVYIGMDQWLQQIFVRLSGNTREVIDFATPDEDGETETENSMEVTSDLGDKPSGKDMSIYFPLIRKIFRIGLLIFLFFAARDLWGIEIDIGWVFARSFLGVIIALLLGLIVWEIAKAAINRRRSEETPLQSYEGEE
ncbi:MAG: hypothetical protein AB2L11_13570 [Syntrophobacteraceae bacterium]